MENTIRLQCNDERNLAKNKKYSIQNHLPTYSDIWESGYWEKTKGYNTILKYLRRLLGITSDRIRNQAIRSELKVQALAKDIENQLDTWQ